MNDQPQNSAIFAPERDDTGKFLPGSGGRPRGSKNLFAASTLKSITDLTPDALAGLKANVAANNMDAIKWVLERVVGKTGRKIALDGNRPEDVSNALIDGDLNPDEALVIASVLEKLGRVEEMSILSDRLAQIEKLLKGE